MPEAEINDHMLLQEQTSTDQGLETAHKSSLQPGQHRLNQYQYSENVQINIQKMGEFCGERGTSTMHTDEINVIQVCLLIICADIYLH